MDKDYLFTIECEKKDSKDPRYRYNIVKITISGDSTAEELMKQVGDLSAGASVIVKLTLGQLDAEVEEEKEADTNGE